MMDVPLTTCLLCVLSVGCLIGDIRGCPNGWIPHDESCYLYVKEPYNWINAQGMCQILNGHLVEIDTGEENEFVQGVVHSHGGTNTWIGLEDVAEEGIFVFPSTQTRPSQYHWNYGEPQDNGGVEDCVFMDGSGQWGDHLCGQRTYPSMCEMPNDTEVIVG